MKDNLEHGWIGSEDKENNEIAYYCSFCGEPIYYGEDYYDINDEKICCACISDCKRSAD